MALDPTYFASVTTNLRVIAENSYEARNDTLWWEKITARRTSKSKREVLAWLINQWKLNIETTEGQVEFEEAIVRLHEYVHKFETDGLELFESDFEDADGHAITIATDFVKKMGSEFSYSPQRQLAAALKANQNCYDGQPFFSPSHPVSGKAGDLSLGTYANIFGSRPIDDSVTIEVAKKNLGAVVAAARGMKAPDGSPRSMRAVGLLVPGEMETRATDLLGARFIGSAGSTDHTAVVSSWKLGMPVVADELGANYGGSATDYYLIMADAATADLGAFVWSVRDAYTIKYPSMQDALYQESGKLRWVAKGRTALVPGHPFLLVKGQSAAL